jgi:hypothetical protein
MSDTWTYKEKIIREISSSHGGEYDVQSCLLGCTVSFYTAVQPRRQLWTKDNKTYSHSGYCVATIRPVTEAVITQSAQSVLRSNRRISCLQHLVWITYCFVKVWIQLVYLITYIRYQYLYPTYTVSNHNNVLTAHAWELQPTDVEECKVRFQTQGSRITTASNAV